MKRVLLTLVVFSCGLSTLAIHAQTVPLPYGTVQGQGTPGPCKGGGWVTGETCIHATMHCTSSLNVDDLGFTYGYLAPSGSNNGTVVALAGGAGTAPATSVGGEVLALQYYLAHNLEIVQVKWDSDWEMTQNPMIPDSFGNIQSAACRPAGLLRFVHDTPALFQAGGGMCARVQRRISGGGLLSVLVRSRLGNNGLLGQRGIVIGTRA
jgi:hypothetical protein